MNILKINKLKVFKETYEDYDNMNYRKLREVLRIKDEEIIQLHKELASVTKENARQKILLQGQTNINDNGGVPMQTVSLLEPGYEPQPVYAVDLLGTLVKVYLIGRAVDYEAFYFMPTAIKIADHGFFYDGYDDERINLRIALKDIDYVMKGGNK